MVLPLLLIWQYRIVLETVSGKQRSEEDDRTLLNVNLLRGATWVALHNGGGVGWGEVVNGGFGLVLDGSKSQGLKAEKMLGKNNFKYFSFMF